MFLRLIFRPSEANVSGMANGWTILPEVEISSKNISSASFWVNIWLLLNSVLPFPPVFTLLLYLSTRVVTAGHALLPCQNFHWGFISLRFHSFLLFGGFTWFHSWAPTLQGVDSRDQRLGDLPPLQLEQQLLSYSATQTPTPADHQTFCSFAELCLLTQNWGRTALLGANNGNAKGMRHSTMPCSSFTPDSFWCKQS